MGVYLSTPKTEKFSEDGENHRVRFGLSSMQGWRTSMEDAHAALPDLDSNTSFFGVYDGHGGKVVAKFCAKYLHTQVLKNEASAGDLGVSAQKAFFRMDEMMRGQRGWRELAVLGDKLNKFSGMIEGLIWSPRGGDSHSQVDDWAFEDGPHSDFPGPTSGCTACVAIIRDNHLVVANAGDSRCVISRKGQAYNLSRDHKPDLEVERDRILKAGGFIHAGRVNGSLNLARAIGDMEFKQNKFLPAEKQIVTANPDINIVELCEDDEFIVLACDGIWDCMSSQQLVDFIHEYINTDTNLSAICERVFDKCLAPSTADGEGCDNMTMILVQLKKPITKPNDTDASSSEQSLPRIAPMTDVNETTSTTTTENEGSSAKFVWRFKGSMTSALPVVAIGSDLNGLMFMGFTWRIKARWKRRRGSLLTYKKRRRLHWRCCIAVWRRRWSDFVQELDTCKDEEKKLELLACLLKVSNLNVTT